MKNINQTAKYGIFLILMLLFAHCQSDVKNNLKAYYYPVKPLTDAKVYEYHCTSDTTIPPYYWYFRTIVDSQKVYFTGNFYDHTLTTRQFVREEMTEKGMILRQLFVYQTNEMTQQQERKEAKINVGAVYPFAVTDTNSLFVYNIAISDKENTSNIVRNRRLKGETEYIYKGKKYAAVMMEVREESDIFNPRQGHLTLNSKIVETYCEGLGLVKVERNTNDNKLIFELKDTYPMSVLEQKFKTRL